jgi:phospholipid N-methyltransferase
MQYLRECRQFYRQFREQFFTTGSIIPSSRTLARALTRPLRLSRGPRRILEVGPGTGAVTAEIVRLLRPGDELDIVELNADFVAVLEGRFRDEPEFRRRLNQTRLFHAPLQEIAGEHVYDVMVSGVPLANFPVELVDEIYRSYMRLLKPTGTLSFFEYLWLRDLKQPFVGSEERQRLQKLGPYLEEKLRRYQLAEEVVMLNVPPAVARHVRFGPWARRQLV